MDHISKAFNKTFKKTPKPPVPPHATTVRSVGDRFNLNHARSTRSHRSPATEFRARPSYGGPDARPDVEVLDISRENSTQRSRGRDLSNDSDADIFYRDEHYDHTLDEPAQAGSDTFRSVPTPGLPERNARPRDADNRPRPYFEPWKMVRGGQQPVDPPIKHKISLLQPLPDISHRQNHPRTTPEAYSNLSHSKYPVTPHPRSRLLTEASVNRPHPPLPHQTTHTNLPANTLGTYTNQNAHGNVPTTTQASRTRPLAIYQSIHANLSTRTLGPKSPAYIVEGPVSHRPVIRQTSTPAIYHQAIHHVPPLPDMSPYHPARKVMHGPREPSHPRLYF